MIRVDAVEAALANALSAAAVAGRFAVVVRPVPEALTSSRLTGGRRLAAYGEPQAGGPVSLACAHSGPRFPWKADFGAARRAPGRDRAGAFGRRPRAESGRRCCVDLPRGSLAP